MMALLLLAIALFVAASVGRPVLGLLRTVPDSRLDRLTYSTAIGLGMMAYVVLLLGLVGLLTLWPVVAGMVGLLLLSWVGMLETVLDLQPRARQAGESGRRRVGIVSVAAGVLLAVLGAIVVINCFVPPGPHEWDALSYHLAAPKVYLAHHRIVFLPTDHHSNFPFLVEMLFTLGLLFQGYALANLFHFAMGALTVSGILFIGRRHFGGRAGLIGALAFATTPIVVWEAGAAYIELGMACYVLLAFGAALEFRESREPRWLALAGILMGFALSVKALALVPLVLLGALVLLGGYRFKNLRWYLVPALIVGCPFYVKATVTTGNPVYPFAYRLFGGRYWSQELADAYAGTQGDFGLHNSLLSPTEDMANVRPDRDKPTVLNRARNTILVPFALISVPRIFYDYQDPGVLNHLGFLFLALPMVALVMGNASPSAKWFAGAALAWYLVWAQTMQYTRYIIPVVPLLVLVGAQGSGKAMRRAPAMRWLIGGAVFFQAALVLAYWLPRLVTNSGGDPGQVELATSAEARDKYLTRRLNYYSSVKWVNANTPANAGVVLFDEARGFYLDRPYLWGNQFHSTYIPYATFANGREMADWFLAHGYRYALVNMQYSQEVGKPGAMEALRNASATGTLPQLFLEWYDPKLGGERFRQLLGEAVLDGAAAFVPDATLQRTVVLEFRPGTGR
jgi:hypothetical protein